MHATERHRGASKGSGAEAVSVPKGPAPPSHSTPFSRPRRERRRCLRRLLLCGIFSGLALLMWMCYIIVATTAPPLHAATSPPPAPSSGPPTSMAPADVQYSRRPGMPWASTPLPALPFNATATTGAPTAKMPSPPPPLAAHTSAPVVPTERDVRTVRPHLFGGNRMNHREEGEYEPEEPERLPGLRITRRTFTPAELLERFGDTDIVYSFVNGTEVNHHYRKLVRQSCISNILQLEAKTYENPGLPPFQRLATGEGGDTVFTRSATGQSPSPFKTLSCGVAVFHRLFDHVTLTGELLATVTAAASGGADNRDRETDELRHSLRSVEQHMQWHRGRVVMVSPGHHPTWVDGAKNFLSGMCGGAAAQEMRSRGAHLRVTTVHQDALMPYGMRLTADSHVIEQHLWRVRNITAAHVYMNDDYFVNRDVAITDLFNEYGGTIVRTESSILSSGAVAGKGGSWSQGVSHAQQFNIQELDVRHEDELPESLIAMWKSLGRVSNGTEAAADGLPALKGAQLDEAVDVAKQFTAEPLPTAPLAPRRPRRYATHAPFVYCTNMMRFFEDRYEREFSAAALRHRGRKARDLFIPFLYNAFIMARPWQASPKFLPYLLALHRSRRAAVPGAAPAPSAEIALDNFDGCGPASLRGGMMASECQYGKFQNNVSINQNMIREINARKSLYFNINAGFNSLEAAAQLRMFLGSKFATPVYVESAPADAVPGASTAEVAPGGEDGSGSGAAPPPPSLHEAAEKSSLAGVFDALMALPVVGLVSDEEGACPLVRSLALAFAGHHRGPVHLGIARGEAGALRATRAALRHRVVSAMPAAACAYGSAVTMGNCSADESAAAVAARVLGDGGASGVVLPSTCGGAGGSGSAARGMRVRGFVVDARTPGGLPVRSAAALREALAVPAQTLALEDFRAVRVGPAADDVVLVLSRGDAAAAAVHWVAGASESDLLVTYPLPVAQYENMSAPVRWSIP